MITVPQALIVLAAVQAVELIWLVVLTFVAMGQRRRHTRLNGRVSTLAANVTKVGRSRTKVPAGATSTALITRNPTPPYPTRAPNWPTAPPAPTTVPIAPARGRHSR